MNDRDKKIIFIALSLISFLATYTASAINVALPAIGAELGLSHTGLQYILTAYLMMNAALMVLYKSNRLHPVNNSFTTSLIIFPSALPFNCGMSLPMTLPVSGGPFAPTSAMTACAAAVTSSRLICLGR